MEKRNNKRLLIRLLFIFSIASCSLLVPTFFPIEISSAIPTNLFFSKTPVVVEPKRILLSTDNVSESLVNETQPFRCSSVKKNSICCDRNSLLSDVCVLRGDIYTHPSTSSIFLSRTNSSIMTEKINELSLSVIEATKDFNHRCDVVHRVPAIVFSAFNGDISREFNEGLIPLFTTSRRYNRRVVFLVMNYQNLWRAKYQQVLSRLSAYPPIDFFGDNRTHCFPEMTVGLRMHGEFSINPRITNPANLSIIDFRQLLFDAYGSRIRYLEWKKNRTAEKESQGDPMAPKLLILFENGMKLLDNENELVELCEDMGFKVEVLKTDRNTEIENIYSALNSTDAVLGVSGCSLAHLLFMRTASIFIQVLPLGIESKVEARFGNLAKEIGVEYFSYRIETSESLISMVSEEQRAVKIDLNGLLSRLTHAFQQIIKRKIVEDSSNLRWNENWLPRESEHSF